VGVRQRALRCRDPVGIRAGQDQPSAFLRAIRRAPASPMPLVAPVIRMR
jgi:hypothetical protein